MNTRARTAFAALVLVQLAHAIEEYASRLFEVWGPTRVVSGLFSRDLATGFAIANALILLFGLWCWLVPLRSGRPWARAIAWGWAAVECANGIFHVALAASRGGYFPGVGTAPLLIGGALYLARRLISAPR